MKNNLNEKIEKLNTAIEWFYGDNFKLEEASTKYREARELAKMIESDLENLKNEINIIDQDFSQSNS